MHPGVPVRRARHKTRERVKPMAEILEGSEAIARAVALAKPAVVSAYPITPQTHIVENIARLIANGEFDATTIEVESEFSALSAAIGASAAGARAYTATASQGLALMHEVLFAAAGMRLPIVMNVVNRALSAPINIWNDHQDSVSQRDTGWLQFYVESIQEAVDTTLQAFRIAEDRNVLLPVMVCLDGFYLSHTMEPVELPTRELVDNFLPPYQPEHAYLDPLRPITQGPFAYPEPYYLLRKDLSHTIDASVSVIRLVHSQYARLTGRSYGDGLMEVYNNTKDRKKAIVVMGSLAGNCKEVADRRDDVGVVRIRCYRPFPHEEVIRALRDKELVIVIEKNISLGKGNGALFDEVRSQLYHLDKKPRVVGVVGGLGGTEISVKEIENIVEEAERWGDGHIEWRPKL